MHTSLWRRERSDVLGRQLNKTTSNGSMGRPSLDEALLLPSEEYSAEPAADPVAEVSPGTTGLPASVCNLVNTLVGAGVVALPRLVATLGLALGAGALVLVSLLSIATLAILTRASSARRQWTYTELVQKGLGPAPAQVLQWAVVLNNAGLLITYLIMLGDVLVGTAPGYTGVVSNLAGLHGGPWYVGRPFVVAVACVVVLLPLVSLRSLKGLVGVSILGLVLAVAFGVLSIALACLAWARGSVHSAGWWPDPDLAGGTALGQLATFIGTLPVAATAYICHYQIHPLMRDLRDFSVGRMLSVVYCAMGLATVAYLAVGVGLHLVFQGDVESDVLLNFVPGALAPLVGDAAAAPLCYAVWLGYAANLCITYPMILWAGREMALQLLLRDQGPQGEAVVPQRVWLAFSWGTVAVTYGIAMLVPDIWPVITVTGATAGVAIGYGFPACLFATFPGPPRGSPGGTPAWARQAVKWALLALSLLVAVLATGQQLWPLLGRGAKQDAAPGGDALHSPFRFLEGPGLGSYMRLH